VYIPRRSEILEAGLQEAIANQLSKYKQPKHWIPVQSLPRNAQGKVNRKAALDLALNVNR
ncbi:MAG TPA: hypothetical protein V6D29_25000, partial [Leptolyngbyaceae cyanobacterium]